MEKKLKKWKCTSVIIISITIIIELTIFICPLFIIFFCNAFKQRNIKTMALVCSAKSKIWLSVCIVAFLLILFLVIGGALGWWKMDNILGFSNGGASSPSSPPDNYDPNHNNHFYYHNNNNSNNHRDPSTFANYTSSTTLSHRGKVKLSNNQQHRNYLLAGGGTRINGASGNSVRSPQNYYNFLFFCFAT